MSLLGGEPLTLDHGSPGALWVKVDPALFVGNDRGRYLGSIEVDEAGAFVAYGADSAFCGRFDALEDAKRTLSARIRIHGDRILGT